MARIRSIKPDFWTDEKVVELSPWERLLFIGVWNFTDDQGYIDNKPRRLKMQVFPGDDMSVADVEVMIANLVAGGFLEEYDSPIGPVLYVRNWARHQRVDRPSLPRFDVDSLTPRGALAERSERPSEPRNEVPGPQPAVTTSTGAFRRGETRTDQAALDTEGADSTSPRRALDEDSRPSVDAEGKGVEGKGREVNTPDSPKPASKPRQSRTVSTEDPDFDRFWAVYPRLEAKKDALKAWPAAVKAVKGDVDKIIAAAERYRDRRRGQDPQHTKYPAGWLNGERWNDEPPATGSFTADSYRAPLPPSSAPTAIPANERCPAHRGEIKGQCRHCHAIAIGRPRGN